MDLKIKYGSKYVKFNNEYAIYPLDTITLSLKDPSYNALLNTFTSLGLDTNNEIVEYFE